MARDLAQAVNNALTRAITTNSRGPFTMAGWVKMDSSTHPSSAFILSNGNNSGGGNGIGLGFQNANSLNLAMCIQGLAWVGSAFALTVGIWQHVCMRVVAAGGAHSFLVDGSQKSTTNQTMTTPAGSSWIGGPQDGVTGCVDMKVGEVAHWSAVLSDEEVLALAKGVSPRLIRASALLAHWPVWGLATSEIDLSGAGRPMAVGSANPPVTDHCPSMPSVLFPS